MEPTTGAFHLIAAATDRLLDGLAGLGEADVRAPSRLPGWTRAHVLSHLIAQVAALERLLAWAATGVEQPQYAGRAERDAEIDAGSAAGVAELVAGAGTAAARLRATIERLPADAWAATIRPFTGEICTPRRILVIRLREVEIHHVDLAVGYAFGDIPAATASVLLDDVGDRLADAGGMPDLVLRDGAGTLVRTFGSDGPTVTGSRGDLLAWLAGRSTGAGLRSRSALPVLPGWI